MVQIPSKTLPVKDFNVLMLSHSAWTYDLFPGVQVINESRTFATKGGIFDTY